jgi:hypothetical protein
MLLMRLHSETKAADAHPDRDELLAYQIRALGTGREASIRKHLAQCRRCVSKYARIRVGRQEMRYSSPPHATVQATMVQFRPRTIRRLGRLLIERVGESLALSFLRSVPAAETDRHPASASRRAMRVRMITDERVLHVSKAPPSSPGATIESSPWSLRLTSVSGSAEDSIRVALASDDEGLSAEEITIRILSEGREEYSAVTDAQGVAVLPCPPGESRLIVEVDPPLSLEIEFEFND